jgi:Zinc finger, C3HC4 type (RING finger)
MCSTLSWHPDCWHTASRQEEELSGVQGVSSPEDAWNAVTAGRRQHASHDEHVAAADQEPPAAVLAEPEAPSAPMWQGAAAPSFRRPTGHPADGEQDDSNLCVVCQDAPAEAGLLHGTSVHRCLCKGCACMYQRPDAPTTCPMCREAIQAVVTDIF